MQKSLSSIYLLIIAFMVGIEFALGALVAPTIFFPAKLIGEGVLSHFQSGLLMSNIFVKFNFILLFSIIIFWLYELYAFKIRMRDWISLALLFIVTLCSLLFTLYYTPFILQAQKMGESMLGDAKFQSMHLQSEWDIKILMIMQIALFMRRFFIMQKSS